MALINCPECKKEISDHATACPSCGFPISIVEAETVTEAERDTVSENVSEVATPNSKSFYKIGIIAFVCVLVVIAILASTAEPNPEAISTKEPTEPAISVIEEVAPEIEKKPTVEVPAEPVVPKVEEKPVVEPVAPVVPAKEPEAKENLSKEDADTVTIGQRNALSKAKEYLAYTAFSKSGLIKQLEFEKFSNEDSVYAVDNCGADWNEQATKKAKDYLDYSSFSRDSLIEQLKFEGFTNEQAVFGVEANGY